MRLNKNYIDTIIEESKNFNAKKVILFGSALENPKEFNDIDLASDIPRLDFFICCQIRRKVKNSC